jgi:hypothetical protein
LTLTAASVTAGSYQYTQNNIPELLESRRYQTTHLLCLHRSYKNLFLYFLIKSKSLLIFERKIFRRIYGLKYENGEWKSRTNRKLEEMNGGENIVKWIKRQRISWLGHLERMEEDRISKKIFIQELEGTRRRGRPRKRWKDEVERDLQVLGVRRWR